MVVNLEENGVTHPNGKIILMNGNIIDGFPLNSPQQTNDNSDLQLDTSGVYLRLAGQPVKTDAGGQSCTEKIEMEKLRTLFRDNAHALYQHRNQVYADSRMFLCPVDTGSGMAYTGRSGFTGATLGVWLEWWDALVQYMQDSKVGKMLVWYIAGSPLSGSNRCRAVLTSGQDIEVSFPQFLPIWKPFISINKRYAHIRGMYEAYSLERTLQELGIVKS